MPNWEEDEFEMQQQAIRKWAKKKFDKLTDRWIRRVAKYIAIYYGPGADVYIDINIRPKKAVDDNGKQVE